MAVDSPILILFRFVYFANFLFFATVAASCFNNIGPCRWFSTL